MSRPSDGLAELHCSACKPDSPPVESQELEQFLQDYPAWRLTERQPGLPQLERIFTFKTYAQAAAFTSRVAALAEQEDHHPAILLEWGKVTVSWWTHAIRGLHRNDLIMAAQTEQAYQQQETASPRRRGQQQNLSPSSKTPASAERKDASSR